MALCSLNSLIYCDFGYSFMSDSAILETLKYSAYSCVPICTDSTSAKANTGLLPVILPCHQNFSCIYGMGVLIVRQSSGVWFLTTLYLSSLYGFFFLGYNLKAVPLLDLGECKVYYGHDISSLYFLDLYICLKDSSFLISKICFKRFHFKFIFYLYQWEVTKLAFF